MISRLCVVLFTFSLHLLLNLQPLQRLEKVENIQEVKMLTPSPQRLHVHEFFVCTLTTVWISHFTV